VQLVEKDNQLQPARPEYLSSFMVAANSATDLASLQAAEATYESAKDRRL